ncbi:F-box/FBD/LRR-repeat protein At1g13570-like [Cicer arietinum]|uniref:F-box/FBD/LRR-repeat protein At1g13570-like isoform X2 n=1 Tax=Cicer arietinum TaxID=3827 RepID=A0A1S2XJJ4_CICAR|nr:F-box/FBD/LRR-repeat protein At1g13570-like isoform X2 [Cicer arietinum]
MTQSKKKADCGDHTDLITDLPWNVIDGILKYLNIRELVGTSILSRKWRYMWMSVLQLEFDEDFFYYCEEYYEGPEISRIMMEILMLHSGPLYKFTLSLPSDFMQIDCLDELILFLSTSGIKDLELQNLGFRTLSYQVPSYVFSCQELTSLDLNGFELSVPPNFGGLKRLIVLNFHLVTFESGALEKLIPGFPLLERLTISFCSGLECIDLSAPTLKVLRINSEGNIKTISLKNANNLIDFSLLDYRDEDSESVGVSCLIKSLPKIQRLVMEIFSFYYKVLYAAGGIRQSLVDSFSSLEYLQFVGTKLCEREGVLYIVSVLTNTPNLVELVVKNYEYGDYDDEQEPDQTKELESNGCCLGQLRKVKIEIGKLPAQLSISRDLLWMKRASQKAQVEFIHSKQ